MCYIFEQEYGDDDGGGGDDVGGCDDDGSGGGGGANDNEHDNDYIDLLIQNSRHDINPSSPIPS